LNVHPEKTLLGRTTTSVVKRSRKMYGRKYNSALLAGLTRDLIRITIRAIGARPSYRIISTNHFFEREEK